MESQKPLVEYYDFDFEGMMHNLAQKQHEIIDAFLNIDDADSAESEYDENGLFEALSALATGAQAELNQQKIIGSEVMLPPGALIPSRDEDGSLCVAESKDYIYGTYRSLIVFAQVNDGAAFEIPRIYHRIALDSDTVSTPFYEAHQASYATLPIESNQIDIFQQTTAYSNINERWLKSVTRDLRNDSVINFGDVAKMYDRIINAKYSKMPVDKNVDWFIDHLREIMELDGTTLTINTGLCEMFMDGKKHILSDVSFTGKFVDFCTMPNYAAEIGDGRPDAQSTAAEEIALWMTYQNNGEMTNIKVPLRSIIDVELSGYER